MSLLRAFLVWCSIGCLYLYLLLCHRFVPSATRASALRKWSIAATLINLLYSDFLEEVGDDRSRRESSSIQTPPAWILCLSRKTNLKPVSFKRLVDYRTRHSFSKHLLKNCRLLPMPPTCYSLIWNFQKEFWQVFSVSWSSESTCRCAAHCTQAMLRQFYMVFQLLKNPRILACKRNVWRDSLLSHGLHLQSQFKPPRGWSPAILPSLRCAFWTTRQPHQRQKFRLIVLQVMERFLP